MGLFGKKYCDICGKKIGLFGTKKIEDGNICGDCADRLSPWFDGRRHSTLEEIRQQLAYREENKKAVAAFQQTLQLGDYYRILLDENAGTFMVVRESQLYMLETVNPDVFRLSDIKDARLNITDTRSELYTTDREGNKEPYNPRRFRYTYRFYLHIDMEHPYVDDIEFQLNEYPLEIEGPERSYSLFGSGFNPTRDYDYRSLKRMGEEIVGKLLNGRQQEEAEEQTPEPASQPAGDTCPYCGSPVNGGNFCENCGAKLR